MLLALDVGNTNVTIGVYEGDKLRFVSRMTTDSNRMEDQYAIELSDILTLYGIDKHSIDGAVICSVVPALTKYMSAAVKKLSGVESMIVGAGIKTGLNILLDDPKTMGGDLVAGCVGALASVSCPAIIIDMGTATTICVLDKDKNFVGGAILPGVGISLGALTNKTAQLPQVEISAPSQVIGTNTIDCIKSGVVYGNAAMIDGICERIEQELSSKATIVATGGLAKEIIPHCKKEIIYNENLLLDGLYLLYKKNTKPKAV